MQPRITGDIDTIRRRLRMPNGLQWILERSAADPVFFCEKFFEVRPTRLQARWLRSMARERHLVAGRRGGKSFTEAVKTLHEGTFRAGSRFLNTARTYNQAMIIPNEMLSLMMRTQLARGLYDDVDRSPFFRLKLSSGTDVWARSLQNGGDNIRGEWFDKLNNDEAAFGSKYDLSVLMPTLADTGGAWSTTSTPNGLNYHYNTVDAAERKMATEKIRRRVPDLDAPGWSVQLLDHLKAHWTSYDNPFLSAEAIADMKSRLSPTAIQQEIDAIFLEVEGAVCKAADLAPVSDGGIRDDDLHTRAETGYVDGGVFLGGCDLGRWRSWAVLVIIRVDVRPWRVVKVRAWRGIGWEMIQAEIEEEIRRYKAQVLFDTTKGSVGDVLFDYLNVPGDRFEFTKPSKEQLLLRLKLAIQRRIFVLPFGNAEDEEMFRQLGLYGTDPEGDDSETWDYIMALALAIWQAEQNPAGSGGIVGSDLGSAIVGLARSGRIARLPIIRRPRGLWLPRAA